jgi:phosphopantothenoylcysteine decarboxylase/phosphopantothenate--cysteine ligase
MINWKKLCGSWNPFSFPQGVALIRGKERFDQSSRAFLKIYKIKKGKISMAKIGLGVCSSVSIYKACEILRGFQKKEFEVQVIMTKNATQLVSPLLFSAISGQKAIVDLFEKEEVRTIGHVALAKEISLLVVAPATANILAKFASGLADDFLSTLFLSVECPVLIAAAMNEAMYLHPQTQMNIQKLKSFGVHFVEPEKGYLACQEEGWGRLASPERIVEEGLKLIHREKSLKGKTALITAGPTREFLDPVRFLSNRSSGKMGYELAAEALSRGAEVILISGPTHLLPPAGAKVIKVQTAQEMKQEVGKNFTQADIVLMASAISDFRFRKVSSQKIKKQNLPEKIELVRTPDILKKLGLWKKGKVLVGFAAETTDLVRNALQKIKEKNLDMIVANDVSQEGIGFESNFNQVSLIDAQGHVLHTERLSKCEISRIILDQIEALLEKKS